MFMKYFLWLSLLLLANSATSTAQNKRFRIEVGLKQAIGLTKGAGSDNSPGIYINSKYRLRHAPLSLNLKVSLDHYTYRLRYYSYQGKWQNHGLRANSLAILPGINRHWTLSNKISWHAGISLGLSFDNLNTGVFNEGFQTHAVLAPQVGIDFWKRVNLSARYYITHPDFTRLMVGIGYTF